MNKIQKINDRTSCLPAGRCPNGVELKKLGEVTSRVSVKNRKNEIDNVLTVSNSYGFIRQEDYFESGNRIASANTQNYTIVEKGYIAFNPRRINVGSIALLEKDEIGIVSPAYQVFKCDETQINPKFLLHLIKGSKEVIAQLNSFYNLGVTETLNYENMINAVIPVPPLSIQQEIVNILDKFTELEAELQAELEARKKQYEYYRNSLLTFSNICPPH